MIKAEVLSIIKKNLRSELVRKSFVLISGSAVAQIIPIITAPLITRLYSPQSYGLLGLYIMVSSIAGLLATLQMQFAIVKEKDDSKALDALKLCLIISIVIGGSTAIPVLLFRHSISEYFNSGQLSSWLLFLPLSVIMSGWTNSIMAWANRKAYYKVMSFNRIVTALIIPLFSISLAFMFEGAIGLFVGLIMGQIIPFLILAIWFWKNEPMQLKVDRRVLYNTWKEHISFPKFNLPSEFLNILIAQFPLFILGRYYGLAALGQYNLSNRILNTPSFLVSQSVAEIFRQRASKDYNENGNCESLFKKSFISLLLLGLMPFTIILIFGPQLFVVVFGEGWLDAGVYSRILAPMFFLRFIISPLTFVCFLASKHYVSLAGSLTYAVTTILVSYLVMSYSDDVFHLLTAYVINFSCIYLVMFYLNYKYSKGNVNFR